MATPHRVLVIDDDPDIREMLTSMLGFAGFAVDAAADAAEASEVLEARPPDAVVLDVMLPDVDGFAFLRRLRAHDARLPVLFLTARDTTEDRVRGLALGGDDYVTKPFSMAEVEARLRALLRRAALPPPEPGDAAEDAEVLVCADLRVDEHRHLVARDDRLLDLSPTEFRLLLYLLRNQGRVMSKSQILDRVWQYDFGGDANVVERFVSNLRQKLDAHGAPLIHTVRGFGYTIRPPAP